MIPRITFLLIAVFWVAMNVLLWRAEYDSHGIGVQVPTALVWQKILTAPDISSLTVFQDGQRTGFCEFSTSVEQEMATLDESNLVPQNVHFQPGYKVWFNGNVGLGGYTNRLNFNGQLEFSRQRAWQELNLKLLLQSTTIKIYSRATEQKVQLIVASGGVTNTQVFSFAELQDPKRLLHSFLGNFGDWTEGLDWSVIPQMPAVRAQDIHWEAHSDRLTLGGNEPVTVYRLDTRVLDYPIVIYASTLGEILRVELPGGIVASFDQPGTS